MDPQHGNMGINVEGDRLSNLQDNLIHKILSFTSIKDTIATSALSSRWRYIWTSTPYINLSTQEFSTLPEFNKFVTRFLPRRNNLTELDSMKFSFRGKVSETNVKRILDYAFSHNIQRLEVIRLLRNGVKFPLSLFNSESLKHLTIKIESDYYHGRTFEMHLSSTWELPALTTLELHYVTLADLGTNIFLECPNLKNLTLKHYGLKESNGFHINHPLLSNLTIESYMNNLGVVTVVTPQLKNLTIRSCDAKFVISAPDLVSLLYKGHLRLSTDGFHSLEKADICASCIRSEMVPEIICLLQNLHNVQFLTLNLELVELLSSHVELFKHQPSPFVNLKSLKIYPNEWEQTPEKVTIMSNEVKSYLLDNSPKSTLTMVSREEMEAQKIIVELGVLLKKTKDDAKRYSKLIIGENMGQIQRCWNILGVHINKVCAIIWKLQDIENIVTKLPASNRAKIQSCYSSVCAEADNVVNQITDGMKIECDENQSLSTFCFQMNLLQHWRHFLSKLSVPYSR